MVNPFIIFSVGQMLTTLAMLMLTTMLTQKPPRCLSGARQTQLWFLQTVIVQFVFGPSWRLSFRTLLHIDQGGDYQGGSILAIALILTLSFNVWTFYRQILRARWLVTQAMRQSTVDLRGRFSQRERMVRLAKVVKRASSRSLYRRSRRSARSQWLEHSVERDGHLRLTSALHATSKPSEHQGHALVTFRDGLETGGAVLSLSSPDTQRVLEDGQDPLAQASPRSQESAAMEESLTLQERMKYLTGRFAKHAPFWQFITWMRALSLMLTSVSARAIASEDAAVLRGVVWGQAVVAVLILVVFACLHRKVSHSAHVRKSMCHFEMRALHVSGGVCWMLT